MPWFIAHRRLVAGALVGLAVGGSMFGATGPVAADDFNTAPNPTVQSINVGQQRSAALTHLDTPVSNGTREADFYRFWAPGGSCVQIDLRSDSFDTYLLLRQGSTASAPVMAQDDDGGGGTHSRITQCLPSAGNYTVEATSYRTSTYGPYTIQVNWW
jgi:hypothetical protein